jgi:hypothetical protein|tara:strand:- start:277 stop:2076 length:1800 start_codon:yes stop_codon:yes gene_type:complete
MADFSRQHIGLMWADDYKFLPFKKKPVDQFQLALFVEQGYNYVKSYNGQIYENSTMPHWTTALSGIFGLFQQEFSFFKITTLDVSPPSISSVNAYCKKYETAKTDVFHSILMLEAWKPGQYLEIDGEAIVNWVQGDWFQWKADVPFAYSNVGTDTWYCCKVIGTTTYTGQLQELFPFNIPNIHDSGTASHPLIQLTVLPIINPHNDGDKHSFVYMHNGPIDRLKNFDHGKKTVQLLNDEGLHFYMFEPLCEYYWNGKVYAESINNDQQVHTQGYYSEFSHPTRYEDLRAEELDSILEYKQRNGIADGVIQVHTGEYNIANTMPHYSTELTLLCDDLYLQTQGAVEDLVVDTNFEFTKHFMSLNWRYTKHRQLVANFLAGENGYLSWYFKNEFNMLGDDLYFNLEGWETEYPELYKQLQINNQNILMSGPYYIDKDADVAKDITVAHAVDFWPAVDDYGVGQTPSLLNAQTKSLQNFYRDIFVDIVTETRFAQPHGNFSEKLLQPIQYMKPFILLAPPHTLEYFKSFGYQTFSDFWDESYDDIEDHGERLAKIFTIIQDLLKKPIEELREVYKEMMPILEHNNKLFIEKHAKPNYRNTTV